MAGTGPAPKLPHERRNRVPPQRGEWVDLKPLDTPVLPSLPKRERGSGTWSARTKAAWKAWREDPVTSQYGPADTQAALDLVFLYEEWVRGNLSLTTEVRHLRDRLGLNPKGKRDLRWRIVEKKAEAPRRTSSTNSQRRARLSVVK